MNKYYQLSKQDNKATLNIFGDIVDDAYFEGETSHISLANDLAELGEVDEIDVCINSYGGSVSAGISIFNQLKNHKAKVTTICNGFACSIASIIFLAGDERVMCNSSLLMIHSPWTMMVGNAKDLREEADTLDKIEQLSIDIYCQSTGLDEATIKEMLDAETWLSSKEALNLGFATSILEERETDTIVQSVKQSLVDKILNPKVVEKEVVKEVIVEKEVIKEVTVQPKDNRAEKFIKLFK